MLEGKAQADEAAPSAGVPADGYRLLVEQSADVLFHSVEGVVQLVSPSVERLLGYRPDELVGTTTTDLWHPDDGGLVVDLTDRVRAGGSGQVRGRLRHRDGHYVDVQTTVRPVVEPDGRTGAVGSMTDVSDLAEAERASRLLAEHAADVVFRSSDDGVLVWVSPSVEEVLGRPAEGLLGVPFAEFVHPDDLPAFRDAQGALDGGRPVALEFRVECGDGTYRWVSAAVRQVLDADGRPAGRAGGWRVVDAEHAARAALEESERRLRLLMEHAPVGMALVSAGGRFELVNPALCEMLGRPADDLMALSWQAVTHPDDMAESLEQVEEMRSGRSEGFRVRKRYLHARGAVVWCDVSVAAVRGADGALAHHITQVSDVTALVAAEAELAASEAHFRLLALHGTDLVLRCGPDRTVEWVSPSAAAFGWRPEDLVGTALADLVHPDDRTAGAAQRAWLYAGDLVVDPSEHFVVRVLVGGDGYRWVDACASAVVEDGRAVALVTGLRDVHELVETRDRLRKVVEVAPVATALLDASLVVEEANPALCRLLGADRGWVVDRRLDELQSPAGPASDGGGAGPAPGPVEVHLAGPDGGGAWVERSVAPVLGDDGAPRSFVAQFVDVGEARRRREALAHEASHDPLTGLANRRELERRLARVLDHPGRGDGLLGVLAFDVDGLKPVNDELGHPAGDRLLAGTAGRLRRTLRDDDVVARTGGDEFVALLPGTPDLDAADHVAHKVLAAFAAPMDLGAATRPVTVSVGATVARPGEDPGAVLARADAALLDAKAAGRARCVAVPGPAPPQSDAA